MLPVIRARSQGNARRTERRDSNGKKENLGGIANFTGKDSGRRSAFADEYLPAAARRFHAWPRLPSLRFPGTRVSRFSRRHRGECAWLLESAAGPRDSPRSGPRHSRLESVSQSLSGTARAKTRAMVRAGPRIFHQQRRRSHRRRAETRARLRVCEIGNAVRADRRKTRILALENSFHGRTLGALSITHTPKYREPFAPLIPGVEFVRFNDVADLDAKFDSTVCAIVVETIQGEGGVFPLSEEFWERARALTTEHDAALIADEIQTGLGRTGRQFRVSEISNRFRISSPSRSLWRAAFRSARLSPMSDSLRRSAPGMHGSTFGGGPLVCAVALEFLTVMEDEDLLANVRARGADLRAGTRKAGGAI